MPTGMPLQNILAAIMRGNAKIQGETQAKKVASDQADEQSKMTVTMKPGPSGVPLVTVKDAPADLLNQTQDADVQEAHDTPHINVEKKIAQLGAASNQDTLRSYGFVPKDTDIVSQPEKVDQFSERYATRRKLGGGVITSALMAGLTGSRTDVKLRENLQNQNAAENLVKEQKLIDPVLETDARVSGVGLAGKRLGFEEKRANLADTKEEDRQFNEVTKAIDYGKVSFARWREETENALGKPLSKAQFERVVDKGNRDVNANLDTFLGKSDPAQRATLGTYESADAAESAYGGEIPPARKAQFTQTWKASRDQYNLATSYKKAELDRAKEGVVLDRMRIATQREALKQNAELANLNTPEAVAQSANAVLASGNQLYLLPNKTPIERAFRAKVEAQVKATTNGRLPQQIKPGSEDDKRLTVITQGVQDVDKIEEIYNKWLPVAPLGGPTVGALNTAIINNKPSSYLHRVAMEVVPGYAKLSNKQQQEYLTDAATMAHRVNALTGRETRAVAGGRFAVQLFDVYKGTTPGFQSPATFKGLIEGARQEFANAESSITSKQWGGTPPTVGANANATENVISLDDALKHIKKGKK